MFDDKIQSVQLGHDRRYFLAVEASANMPKNSVRLTTPPLTKAQMTVKNCNVLDVFYSQMLRLNITADELRMNFR